MAAQPANTQDTRHQIGSWTFKMWELTKSFRFEAAHSLKGMTFGAASEEVHKTLDHKLLNKIEALGTPTLENLSRFIWERVQHAGKITRVSVHRDSCNESCTYFGPQ